MSSRDVHVVTNSERLDYLQDMHRMYLDAGNSAGAARMMHQISMMHKKMVGNNQQLSIFDDRKHKHNRRKVQATAAGGQLLFQDGTESSVEATKG